MSKGKNIYVTVTDEEGFNTHVVGPFESNQEAYEWCKPHIQTSKENGSIVSEPYQVFPLTSPEDYNNQN